MGSGWTKRVREHVATRVQRCGRHPVHVRSIPQIDVEFSEGVVSASKGFQQSEWQSYPHRLILIFVFDRQTAIPFLIGTKFDQFATFPRDEQEEITKQVRRVSRF